MHTVATATTIETVWDLHCRKMNEYGFDRIMYAFTRFPKQNSVGEMDDALFLTNHDPDYVEAFVVGQMFVDAPVTKWALNNVGACSWGTLWNDQAKLSDRQREIIAFNISMGVVAGYTIRFSDSSSRATGIVVLAGRRGLSQDDVDEIWRKHGREIEVMNHMVHLKVMSLPYRTTRGELTKRQREVLEWIGDGKSNLDIATILGVSLATVEKHLRLARERLGVDTTAQAVLKASFLNQIYKL